MKKFIILCGIIATTGIVVVSIKYNTQVEEVENIAYVQHVYDVDISNPIELVRSVTNVNVVKITGVLEEFEDSEYGLPVTYYSAEVMSDLKGVTEEHIVIEYIGGYDENGTLILSTYNDLLSVGNFYLILSYENENGQYTIDNYRQKILLDHYDLSDPGVYETVNYYVSIIEEQNEFDE